MRFRDFPVLLLFTLAVIGLLLLSTKAFAAFDLRLDSVSSPASATFGDAVLYTIAFSNTGPDTASARLKIEGLSNFTLGFQDVTIAGVPQTCPVSGRYITCPWVSMSSGAMGSATLTLFPAQVGIFNVRVKLYPVGDADSTNNESLQTTAVALVANDLQLSVNGSSLLRNLGENVYYTFTLLNAGPDNATNTNLTVNFSGPFTLASGGSTTCVASAGNTVVCGIGELASAGSTVLSVRPIPTTVGSFGGTASLTSDLVDTNLANSSGVLLPTATIDLALPVADLELTLEASAGSVTTGSPLGYTVTVNNNGPDAAPAVIVSSNFSAETVVSSISGRWSSNPATDSFTDIPSTDCFISTVHGLVPEELPITRCSLPSLASGGRIVVSISASQPSAGTITHNAAVSSSGSSDPVANNSFSLSTTVTPEPPPVTAEMAGGGTEPMTSGGGTVTGGGESAGAGIGGGTTPDGGTDAKETVPVVGGGTEPPTVPDVGNGVAAGGGGSGCSLIPPSLSK